MAYYTQPEEKGWKPDGVTGGSVTIVLDQNNKPDLIIKDAFGKSFSSRDSGAEVFLLYKSENYRTFAILVVENDASGMGTYQVVQRDNGSRALLWTNTKDGAAGIITKVAAYVAECE